MGEGDPSLLEENLIAVLESRRASLARRQGLLFPVVRRVSPITRTYHRAFYSRSPDEVGFDDLHRGMTFAHRKLKVDIRIAEKQEGGGYLLAARVQRTLVL